MKTWLSLLLTLLFTVSLSAFADEEDGTDRGNPGDEYSKEFVSLGFDLAENLAKDPIPGVEARQLLAAVRATALHSEESLVLRGYEVDAINYPDVQKPKIVVSRKGWDRMGEAPHRRVFLVLHEYLSIMGIDDSKYQVSSLLDRAKVCERAPGVRISIERELKKSCFRVIPDDLLYVTKIVTDDYPLATLKPSDLAGLPELDYLSIRRSGNVQVDHAIFRRLRKANQLFLGASMPDLGDCSFFREMPLLNSLELSDTASGAYDNMSKFKPLARIGRACFSALPLLRWNSIAVDGKTTQLAGFLEGFKAVQLQLEGRNLDAIPVAEFKGLKLHYVTLRQLDRIFDPAYITALESVLGLRCATSSDHKTPDGIFLSQRACQQP